MKTIIILTLGLLGLSGNLVAQLTLKPIEIVNDRKFYYEDKRLLPNKDLEEVLLKARNDEVNSLHKSGKDLSTLGKVVYVVGAGLIVVDLARTIRDPLENSNSYGLTLAGGGVMLCGGLIARAGFNKKREAVKKYNALIGN